MTLIKNFDLNLLNKFKKTYLVGMDETGRGSMAGPFVAACCIMPPEYDNDIIKDSKKMSPTKLLQAEEDIIKNALHYEVLEFSSEEIDLIGIQAINIKAFNILKENIPEEFCDCFIVVDGDIMKSFNGFNSLIKGDNKSFSIACASIIAKCHRDRKMFYLDKIYPQYNLAHNKGYGTDYIKAVSEYGVQKDIHRHSYSVKMSKIKF